MTRTVRQLISDALQELGVIGHGVALSDENAALGLRYVQDMHDTLQADRLQLFTVARATHTLTASQQTRTIGAGAHFDTGAGTERPIWITHVGVIPVGQTHEVPVIPFRTREEWLAEPWKSMTDLYPSRYLYEPTYPLGTFTFWPIPTTAPTIAIATPTRLMAPATLNTELIFPPGYHEAWRLNLAKRLQRPFRKAQDPSLKDDAEKALGLIARLNDPGPPPAMFEGSGGYDIQSNRHR